MKHFFLLLVFTAGLKVVSAQQNECICQKEDDYEISLRKGLISIAYRAQTKRQSNEIYYGPWRKGEVLLTNGERITKLYLRYEKYLDELLWLRESDSKQGIIRKSDIAGFTLYDESKKQIATFINKKIKQWNTNDSIYRYLQVLDQGKLNLYAFRNVIELKTDYKLIENTKYLSFNGDHYSLVRLKQRDLLQIPGINKAKMKTVLRSNAIFVKDNEAGFIRAIYLYNQ